MLTDTKIKNAKPTNKRYCYADGNGLYLFVLPSGKKSFKVKKNGIFKVIGHYPAMSLKEARDRVKINVVKELDFQTLYDEYMDIKKHSIGEAHYKKIQGTASKWFTPLWDMPLVEIKPLDIIHILKTMERQGITSLHKKAKNMLDNIFRYAVTMGYIENNPASNIDTSLILKRYPQRHFKHITDLNILRDLLLAIDDYKGHFYTKQALKLLPYVFLRPANVRFALWSEIDLEKKLWTIPASKMKMKKAHITPLTPQMIEIIQDCQDNHSVYVFPSPTSVTRPLSENTLNQALKRLGFGDEITSHGFRHTASTLLNEHINDHKIRSELIELQLAHTTSTVRETYNKALYLNERRKLLEWWSNFLDDLKK